MEQFKHILARAAERKGGIDSVMARVYQPLPNNQLAALTDDRILAEFSKKVFQSGFVWRVVEQKWPNFEDVFFQFDIEKILMMPDEMLERKASDPKIIRNFKKILTIKENAHMLHAIALEHGSAATWLAQWPAQNIVELWQFLKKEGARLGGNTGPYALRALGKDTFLFSRDVEAYLRAYNLIEGGLTSKRTLMQAQTCFNEWQQQSGLSFQEISQIIAYSQGDNHV